jgi:hypothetical protein
MGIWKTSKALIEKHCLKPELVSEYINALNDWRREDVIGSPFAIDDYVLNPSFGSEADLLSLKEKLNKIGIKLFLDFIPNHFGADSSLIKSHPGLFLQTDRESFIKDAYAFYECGNDKKIYIAHGRDPFFPPWSDTAQLNFFEESTRDFLIEKLNYISSVADGIRCDMAMLPLNNVFQNTWSGVLAKSGYKKPAEEFWGRAIKNIKQKNQNFIFIAEVYWGLEWNLQKLGFDYTYDKILMDRLENDDISGIKAHLHAEREFQMRSVRFIENHDEVRAAKKFGIPKSMAAAVVMSTIQGIHLFYDGQFEGRKIKLPIQVGREPAEKTSNELLKFYETLLRITKSKIFSEGNWLQLFAEQVDKNDNTSENILAWQWELNSELRIVAINYSGKISRCRLKLGIQTHLSRIELDDLLTNKVYKRSTAEVNNPGLFIELKEYQSHIFSIKS